MNVINEWKTEPGSGLRDSTTLRANSKATINGGFSINETAQVELKGETRVVSDSSIFANDLSEIRNEGMMIFQAPATLTSNEGTGKFVNNGTLKSTNGVVAISQIDFTNNGSIEGEGGVILFGGNTQQNGLVRQNSNSAVIDFIAGVHTWNEGASAIGLFDSDSSELNFVKISGATWIVNGAILAIYVEWSKGTLQVNADMRIGFSLIAGTTIAGSGTITVVPAFVETTQLGHGTILQDSVNVEVSEVAILSIKQGAVITVNDEAAIRNFGEFSSGNISQENPNIRIGGDSTNTIGAIQNYSIFDHIADGSIMTIDTSFYSDSFVRVRGQESTLSFLRRTELRDLVEVSNSSSRITLEGGPVLLKDLEINLFRSGEHGSFEIKSGTTIFEGNVRGQDIHIAGGTLTGSGSNSGNPSEFRLFGSNKWTAGTIRGAEEETSEIIVEEGGSLEISTGASLNLLDHLRFINEGTVSLVGQLQLILGRGVWFENTGHFQFLGDNTIGRSGSDMFFVNRGVMNKFSGSGTTRVNVPGVNRGTIIALSGVIEFTNEFSNKGNVALAGGTVQWNGGLEIPEGGELTGSGKISGNAENSGTIKVNDKEGLININGNLVNKPNSSIFQQIESVVVIAKYDNPADWPGNPSLSTVVDIEPQIDVSGTATLAGTLEVTYDSQGQAAEGDFIPVLVANSMVGNFDLVLGPRTGDPGFYWGEGMREVEGRTEVGIEYKAVTHFEGLAAAIVPVEERRNNGGAFWDGDDDGVPFIFEFAMGLDYEAFNEFPVSTEQSVNEENETIFTITFPFLSETTEFAYFVEKGDLVNPWEMVEPANIEIIPGEGDVDIVVLTIKLSGNPESGSEFYRLVIETIDL